MSAESVQPLAGLRILEVGGIGPTQLAGTLFADLGAQVTRIERVGSRQPETAAADVLNRGRRSVAVDPKQAAGREVVLRLVERSDALLEGFLPGVMERLELGPDACRARNHRLVYARMTGWGQTGPLAQSPGHDINYLAIAGVLDNLRRHGERPFSPLNLVGDFGGGGMLLAVGVLAGLLQARAEGVGTGIDCAMSEGAALLLIAQFSLKAQGQWDDQPGCNIIDTGAPFYDTYETADGKFIAVGAIEPRFYKALVESLGLGAEDLPEQMDRVAWPAMKDRFASMVHTRTQAEWAKIFNGLDACVTPVLSMAEAPHHGHNRSRSTYVRDDRGTLQPAPAPWFEGRRPPLPALPPSPGEHTDTILSGLGWNADEIAGLRAGGVVS